MRKVTLTGVIWGHVGSNAELEWQHWGCWPDPLGAKLRTWFGGNGNLTKELQKWSKMLHNFTKHRLCWKKNLVSCFDKIIDFLDRRNEIDLISHSRVFDEVPCGKLWRQDKYLNSKTREGDGAGHAERQSTGLAEVKGCLSEPTSNLILGTRECGDKTYSAGETGRHHECVIIISIAHGENRALPRKEFFCPTTLGWRGGRF